jgi:hypothetical protein
MTNRVQVARSSVTGSRPASGSHEPGELYVNWPDKQLGVIDSNKLALDLLVVRYFSEDSNYAKDSLIARNGKIFRARAAVTAAPWDKSHWDEVGGSGQMYGREENKAVFYNSQTVDEDIVVKSGSNGGSFGPVIVSAGFSVTVEPGSVWTVV